VKTNKPQFFTYVSLSIILLASPENLPPKLFSVIPDINSFLFDFFLVYINRGECVHSFLAPPFYVVVEFPS
jgi:hypothetical protein